MNWEREKVIEKNGKKLFWEWEHPTRTDYIADRPDLTLEDATKKTRLLINIVCPNDYSRVTKRVEKIGKHHRLCFALRERREIYMVRVILGLLDSTEEE